MYQKLSDEILEKLTADQTIQICILAYRPKILIDGYRYGFELSEIIWDLDKRYKIMNRLINAGNEVEEIKFDVPAKYKKGKTTFVHAVDKLKMFEEQKAKQIEANKKIETELINQMKPEWKKQNLKL